MHIFNFMRILYLSNALQTDFRIHLLLHVNQDLFLAPRHCGGRPFRLLQKACQGETGHPQ